VVSFIELREGGELGCVTTAIEASQEHWICERVVIVSYDYALHLSGIRVVQLFDFFSILIVLDAVLGLRALPSKLRRRIRTRPTICRSHA